MPKTCIVVADRARARVFLEEKPAEHRPSGKPPRLKEVEDLINPEGALTGEELFANTRSGTNRAPKGAQYEYDDHRERHRQEIERRFANRIVEAIAAFVRRERIEKLVLVADPRMLGILRKSSIGALPSGMDVVELAEDLSWHTPMRIQQALARHGVWPAPDRR
jgi:protein required for attachment to host cells